MSAMRRKPKGFIYVPKGIDIDVPLDVDKVNAVLVENANIIWENYFKYIRWAVKRRRLNVEETYFKMFCTDGNVIELRYLPEEMDSSFETALKYFEETEQYEICQYIVDFKKWLQENNLYKK